MSNTLFDLTGKIALITGASRGIGEEIARLLAEFGAHVIVSSRKIEGCEKVASSIIAAGGSAEAMACHTGDMDQIERSFEMVRSKHGKLDILVNNAATNPYYGHILDTDLSAFQKTLDVNLRGYFFMCIAAGKLMKETGGGSIINTASVAAFTPTAKQGVYSISKAAIVSMTKCFALECAEFGIRVNAIAPGLTSTKFASAIVEDEEIYEQVIKRIPMRRGSDPSEQAGAALYLASEASSFVTGTCMVADGGVTI